MNTAKTLALATGITLLYSFVNVSYAQQPVLPNKINIYCTSNLDGTGQCFEVKTNTLLKCTAVPGEMIPCRIPGGSNYNCIFFSAGLLACNQTTARSIEERAERIQSRNPFESDFDDVLSEPLVNPTDKSKVDTSEPSKEIPDNSAGPKSSNMVKPVIMPTW